MRPVQLIRKDAGLAIAGSSYISEWRNGEMTGEIIDALNSGTPVQERSLHYMPIHSAVRF